MKICNKTRYYVGSSIQLTTRISSHRCSVINWRNYKDKGSTIFYKSVLKYGWNNFKFGILEYIDLSKIKDTKQIKETILSREQYYLDNINPSMNICKTAGSPLGIKHGKLFSINLSKARRGKSNMKSLIKANIAPKVITSETRLKLSLRTGGISVKVFDKSNNLVNQFPNMVSAAKHFGVTDRTISRIFNTGISYDNYIYKFEVVTGHPIIIVNKVNNFVKEYYSMRSAARDIGIRHETISKYINTNKLLNGIYLITRK